MNEKELMSYDSAPRSCKECGGKMIFQGVGEYRCESCGFVDYDDYGKVRLYIEQHRGATASEIEAATGVPQRVIRRLLREARIQVAEGSRVYMKCEICGANIRFGRYCAECERKYTREELQQKQEEKNRKLQGYSVGGQGDEGHRRFIRGEREKN